MQISVYVEDITAIFVLGDVPPLEFRRRYPFAQLVATGRLKLGGDTEWMQRTLGRQAFVPLPFCWARNALRDVQALPAAPVQLLEALREPTVPTWHVGDVDGIAPAAAADVAAPAPLLHSGLAHGAT
jgi:hypothetical protein